MLQQRTRNSTNDVVGSPLPTASIPSPDVGGGGARGGNSSSSSSSVNTKRKRFDQRFLRRSGGSGGSAVSLSDCLRLFFGACLLWVSCLLYSVTIGGSSSSSRGFGRVASPLAGLPPEVQKFEFRGTTRTNDAEEKNKPRIAIVTNAVAFPFGEKTTAQWSMFKEYFANKDCYANTHGYDLIVDSRYYY